MKVLIVAQNEICYNPRLAKAGDFFTSKGCEVTVLNPVVGFATEEVYQNFLSKRDWKVLENRLDKKSFSSYCKWGIVSLFNKLFSYGWKKYNIKLGFPYILSKGVFLAHGMATKEHYDLIVTNLLELLPFVANIKEANPNARLLFDSQEYFIGQYSKYEPYKLAWIIEAGKLYIEQANVVLATTNVMKEKLISTYQLKVPVLRVRNVPSKRYIESLDSAQQLTARPLQLVWHGMSINFGNCRGVHVLVESLAHCKTEVHLYLQGKKVEADYQRLKKRAIELGVWDKISLLPPADPEKIIHSIQKFDVGLTGELPEEDNQLLTSSNKLFEYIGAGLCTIVPDLPGLRETVEEYDTGIFYEPGDYKQLAQLLDSLNGNRESLANFKENSRRAAKAELFWEHDYDQVWNLLTANEKTTYYLSPLGTL